MRDSLLVDQFRNQNIMANFGIRAIRLYQNTYSKVTPNSCRFTPSCSQYGVDAITNYGLIKGIKLTRARISRCRRPNGGYDPVPIRDIYFASKKKINRQEIKQAGFKVISNLVPGEIVVNYEHPFRLILAYPQEKEFLSQKDFQQKIGEINKYVFQNSDFALQYKIAKIEIGIIDNYYLIRLSGSIADEYRETSVEQVINLIIIQLAAFFLVTQEREFKAIYFEVDGQILCQPEPESKVVPKSYTGQNNFWDYTSDPNIWDLYWGDFAVDILFSLTNNLVDNLLYLDVIDSNSYGCDDLDGCDGLDGCDDLDGLDGCDGLDGLDGLGGCDGCDLNF